MPTGSTAVGAPRRTIRSSTSPTGPMPPAGDTRPSGNTIIGSPQRTRSMSRRRSPAARATWVRHTPRPIGVSRSAIVTSCHNCRANVASRAWATVSGGLRPTTAARCTNWAITSGVSTSDKGSMASRPSSAWLSLSPVGRRMGWARTRDNHGPSDSGHAACASGPGSWSPALTTPASNRSSRAAKCTRGTTPRRHIPPLIIKSPPIRGTSVSARCVATHS